MVALRRFLLRCIWCINEETFRFCFRMGEDGLVPLDIGLEMGYPLTLFEEGTVLWLHFTHLKVAVEAAIVEKLIVCGFLSDAPQRSLRAAHGLGGGDELRTCRISLLLAVLFGRF